MLRGIDLPKFRGLIVRRQLKDLTDEGGLIDDARDVFCSTGAKENGSTHAFKWKSGAAVTLGHMDDARIGHLRYKSKQFAIISFEELTEFEKYQFWYMLSRNRSVCGIQPYIRASTNPQPGWVADLLIDGGYVDPKTGYAIEAMSGVIRYIIRSGDDLHWFDTREQAKEAYPDRKPISFTFIRSRLEDNKILLESDPDYIDKLKSLPLVERMRLYDANWIIKPTAGNVFKTEWFRISHRLPRESDWVELVRYWDLAGTEEILENGRPKNDPDYTAGVLMLKTKQNQFYVLDLVHFRGSPLDVEQRIQATAEADAAEYGRVFTRIEADPGQAGKSQIAYFTRLLAGHRAKGESTDRKSKLKRAEPLSAGVETGNVLIMQAPWTDKLINELVAFPSKGVHDDIVDACSGAFKVLTEKKKSSF